MLAVESSVASHCMVWPSVLHKASERDTCTHRCYVYRMYQRPTIPFRATKNAVWLYYCFLMAFRSFVSSPARSVGRSFVIHFVQIILCVAFLVFFSFFYFTLCLFETKHTATVAIVQRAYRTSLCYFHHVPAGECAVYAQGTFWITKPICAAMFAWIYQSFSFCENM